jgi:hypothetical protein
MSIWPDELVAYCVQLKILLQKVFVDIMKITGSWWPRKAFSKERACSSTPGFSAFCGHSSLSKKEVSPRRVAAFESQMIDSKLPLR